MIGMDGSARARKFSPAEHAATEERLKQKIQVARQAYDLAAREFRRDVSVPEAEIAHHNAFQDYRRALHVFNDFILNGKLPED
jgi:hypothetical protein